MMNRCLLFALIVPACDKQWLPSSQEIGIPLDEAAAERETQIRTSRGEADTT